jgi:hypothetical protein
MLMEHRLAAQAQAAAQSERAEVEPGDDQILGKGACLHIETTGLLEALDIVMAEDADLTMAGPTVRVALDAVIRAHPRGV